MSLVVVIHATYRGKPEAGLIPGTRYRLQIVNNGAKVGHASGPHDVIRISELKWQCPYTLRGFLLNWGDISA